MEQHAEEHCSVCGLVPLARRRGGSSRVVAQSKAMQAVLKRAARFAGSDAPVAVLGETGTGKEVVARVLHESSARARAPFVAVNVAALPAELLESELFGHGKGAFTGAATARQGLFEAAHKGTLFLDEIAEMPLPFQAKLLRALQDGEVRRVGESTSFAVDVRVTCATHRDLAARVRDGSFREDLYYRLKVLTLEVPPLRARQDDILPLARELLAEERARARRFTPAAERRLLAHAWPGNVRELKNVVKHGAALAESIDVRDEDLPEDLARAPQSAAPRAPADAATLRSLAEVEREHLLRVLDACGGAQSEAARVLGLSRTTLWRKLRVIEAAGAPPLSPLARSSAR
ncbi:MAG: sigma-54-dependent Fis family transcriptional regulator [Deltaproteobacteria bacterium]|nr:sigma-54-dependent Fis family transcriptional regulator [Deltaproteobacteria bacterium]